MDGGRLSTCPIRGLVEIVMPHFCVALHEGNHVAGSEIASWVWGVKKNCLLGRKTPRFAQGASDTVGGATAPHHRA